MRIPPLIGFAVQTPPGRKWLEPGAYGTLEGTNPKWTRSRVPCPYCKALMRQYKARGVYRIVKNEGPNCIAQEVPRTHIVLACSKDEGGCNERFTMIKDQL